MESEQPAVEPEQTDEIEEEILGNFDFGLSELDFGFENIVF